MQFNNKMNSEDFYKILEKQRLLPIINGDRLDLVIKAIEVLSAAFLPLIEITLRDDNSIETLKAVRKKFPKFIIGAGTIVREKDAVKAVNLGVNFIVSPGLDDDIAKFAYSKSTPFLPGVSTCSEIQRAYKMGLKVLKWFPAKLLGGPMVFPTLDGPFGYYGIKFIPSGGITKENFTDYLRNKNVLAACGSFILPEKVLSTADNEIVLSYLNQIKELVKLL
jgi:2-dehydro-3-deoxyphosphogluconate aldolase / (4S)-4-hydroxy-2-oxoglutarate aldolase